MSGLGPVDEAAVVMAAVDVAAMDEGQLLLCDGKYKHRLYNSGFWALVKKILFEGAFFRC